MRHTSRTGRYWQGVCDLADHKLYIDVLYSSCDGCKKATKQVWVFDRDSRFNKVYCIECEHQEFHAIGVFKGQWAKTKPFCLIPDSDESAIRATSEVATSLISEARIRKSSAYDLLSIVPDPLVLLIGKSSHSPAL